MQDSPTSFWDELSRRRVIRASSVYLAAGFVLLQVADVTFEPLGFPDWAMRALIGLLVVGFVLTALLSWIFDVTPDGIVRTAKQTDDEIQRLKTRRKVDSVVIASLLVVIITLIGRDFVSVDGEAQDVLTANRSLAVLPFESIGAGDDYFADGLSVELVNTLSLIPDLKVASANSSFAMNEDMSEVDIGRSLLVANLVKGSVRMAGDKVRVNVQMVSVEDGVVVWTRTFEHVMQDVFALQDEISAYIATSLKSTLYSEALKNLALSRTDSVEAYNAYLLALHYRREFDWPNVVEQAVRATTLDPEFVAAHTLAARAYLTRVGGSVAGSTAYPMAQQAVDKALAIDAEFAPAVVVQAHLNRLEGRYTEAERLLRKARSLSPGIVSQDLANLLRTRGRMEEALIEYRRGYETDPLGASFYPDMLMEVGEYEEAGRVLDAWLTLSSRESVWRVQITAAWLAILMGDEDEANQKIDQALIGVNSPSSVQQGRIIWVLANLGRMEEATQRHNDLMQKAVTGYVSPSGAIVSCIAVGDMDCAFEWLQKAVDDRAYLVLMGLKTAKILDPMRDDPRFEDALAQVGLLTIE